MLFLKILGGIFIASGLYFIAKIIRLTFRRYDRGLVIDSPTKKRRRIIIAIAVFLITAGALILCYAPKILGAIPALFLLFPCKNANYE